MSILTYAELKTLQKEVARLKEKGEILDPTNTFERRELQAIIRQLKVIANEIPHPQISKKSQRHLQLVPEWSDKDPK